jgi:hypothetical protein
MTEFCSGVIVGRSGDNGALGFTDEDGVSHAFAALAKFAAPLFSEWY